VIGTDFGILFFGADGLPGRPPPLPLLARDVEGSRCPGDPGNSGALTNLNLEMNLYGPGKVDVRIVHHQVPIDDPTYVWSGSPLANCALTLRHKRNHVDLSGPLAHQQSWFSSAASRGSVGRWRASRRRSRRKLKQDWLETDSPSPSALAGTEGRYGGGND
jgi:hypothetical protein